MIITLRPAATGDLPWLEGWFPSVAASVGYEGDLALLTAADRDPALRVRIIERDGEGSGMIVCRTRSPDPASATIEFVGTPPAAARKGYGHRAAALLEEELCGEGVRTLFAPAPAMHGIAVYFWIRLGYRPLLKNAWPCRAGGVAWMRRDIVDVP